MNAIEKLFPVSQQERSFQLKVRRDAGTAAPGWVQPQFVECKKCGRRATRQVWTKSLYVSDFDNVLFTNLKGTFFCTKAASRLMMRQRYGRIINISSVVGLHGNAGQANYAASKAGLIGLTKSVAKEYAARNITANAVAPGFIETDMTAAMPESARAAAAAAIPAGRIGRAEDVAAAVAFLAGEQAGYITGQVLCVDGGMGM